MHQNEIQDLTVVFILLTLKTFSLKADKDLFKVILNVHN